MLKQTELKLSKHIKFSWKEYSHQPLVLWAHLLYDHGAETQTGLREEMLIPVQDWCEENKCGVRISFDMFRFKNREQITMFLLRWG